MTPEPDAILRAVSTLLPLEHVLGVVVVGSCLRDYSDDSSDVDVEVIVSDDHAASFTLARLDHVDVQVLTLRTLKSKLRSPDSIDHWPYSLCRVVYDPTHQVTELTSQLAAWPNERHQAAKVAYFNYLNSIHRLKKCIARYQQLSIAILVGTALTAVADLVFSLAGEWSPPNHWLQENMSSPPELTDLLAAMMAFSSAPDLHSITDLDREVIRYLRTKRVYWYAAKDAVVRAYAERLIS